MLVSIVDAFTRIPGAGNRAGVVVDASGLDTGAMQRIAAAVAASETAFVLSRPGDTAVKLRYFTPTDEIDFCGHATVASFHLLSERGLLGRGGHFRLDCAAGTYDVELEPVDSRHSRVWIVTPQYPWRESPLPIEAVMPLLGGTMEMVDRSLPVLANGHKLFVPMLRRDDVWALSPRAESLVAAARPHGIRGVFAFTRETKDASSVTHARFFAPGFGVPEDPVTGSAHGPLAAYLVNHGVLKLPEAGGQVRVRAEQGDAMGKPGRVELEVKGRPGVLERARIGGAAVTVIEGELRV
ncbi:PhzF family phenazine biosynthesis protein [Hyalangium sp.]|uniref:PhzF family phenazine biosynthesis protein n=1 Tax=Hyalangium sp. TaxID=2028555 RepID=UPI002D631860|nr:PhzF family phenazine biosynthesis protein [Hyalangium sp.]HYH94537.1 PhzF family phenazine biosynthesis protein [Hyalangium sp.]